MNSVTPSAPSPLAFQTTPYPVDGIGTQFPQAQYAEGANDSPPDYIKSATAPYQDERDSEKPDPTKLMTATNQSDIHQQDPLTIFSPPLGPDPVLSTCPICRQNVETKVEYTDGSFTWLLCGLLSMFG
ncbi:Lipopolysaccharide-induced tumor necrosis factor-alpha factor, variant 2 [Clonorchis sinensis]|nr:Lipopolysaccharide-induced tumor necrosis factor-alpha factor, variant 2 [Clonorchis sinensis]